MESAFNFLYGIDKFIKLLFNMYFGINYFAFILKAHLTLIFDHLVFFLKIIFFKLYIIMDNQPPPFLLLIFYLILFCKHLS